MRERMLIVAVLAAVLAALTYPSWRAIAAGKTGTPPRLAPARPGTRCVLPREEMRATHMKLLVEWRELAVRRGVRKVTMADGRSWRVSLTGTCLDCHDDKSKFCDRCHEYAAVSPTCWGCHVVPVTQRAGLKPCSTAIVSTETGGAHQTGVGQPVRAAQAGGAR